jgi:hypothetical protein
MPLILYIYLTKTVTAAAFEAPHWCILCDIKPFLLTDELLAQHHI